MTCPSLSPSIAVSEIFHAKCPNSLSPPPPRAAFIALLLAPPFFLHEPRAAVRAVWLLLCISQSILGWAKLQSYYLQTWNVNVNETLVTQPCMATAFAIDELMSFNPWKVAICEAALHPSLFMVAHSAVAVRCVGAWPRGLSFFSRFVPMKPTRIARWSGTDRRSLSLCAAIHCVHFQLQGYH